VNGERLLKTRISFIDANLDRIGRLMTTLEGRTNPLAETESFLESQAVSLDSIKSTIDDVKRVVEALTKDFELGKVIQGASTAIENTRVELLKRGQALQSSQTLLGSLSQSSAQRRALQIKTQPLEEIRRKVKGVRTMLDDPARRQEAWDTFERELRRDIQDLFAEYVDLIGGLALRDVGLDQDACRLADELFRYYPIGPKYELLAIPSRYRAISRSWGQVIRLGFPEWTIWTLPLAAREYWFAAAGDTFSARETIGHIKVDNPGMQECLADAFGTFALGPAYAYASILLLFDPFAGYASDCPYAPDDNRAHAVLSMLDEMGPRDGPNPFKKVHDLLATEWKEALASAQPPGEEDLQTKGEISAVVKVLARKMTDEFNAGMSVANWERFQEWPALLLKGEEDMIPVAGADLRWVLNAGWSARIDTTEKDLKDLTLRTQRLWKRVVDTTGAGPSKNPRFQTTR
jgi:hypothetical protein